MHGGESNRQRDCLRDAAVGSNNFAQYQVLQHHCRCIQCRGVSLADAVAAAATVSLHEVSIP